MRKFNSDEWCEIIVRSEPLIEKYKKQGSIAPIGDAQREIIAIIKKEGFQGGDSWRQVKFQGDTDKLRATIKGDTDKLRATIKGDNLKRRQQKAAWKQRNKEKIKKQNQRYYLKKKQI